MCSEISRVLKPGGAYILVSYGNPESRLSYLEKPKFNWKVETHTVGMLMKFTIYLTCLEKPKVLAVNTESGNEVHYVYVCIKE
jgi:hypothetical protein